MGRISVERATAIARQHPLPIADAMTALVAAESLHERRDRVVECFRATLRYVAALALAARVQFGPGPAPESSQVADMMRSLRRRGLTDGQWVGLLRHLLAAWAKQTDSHALPPLAALFTGKAKKHVTKAIDGLLEMRKAETVAHGATGTREALLEVLDRREPQLDALLERLEPVWEVARLAVPLSAPEDDEPQRAWLLVGDTPSRGRWPVIELVEGERLEPGHPVLLGPDDRPRLALDPVALFRRPSPDAVEELFVLDGAKRKAAVFVALPSMAELKEREVWGVLGDKLFDEEGDEELPPESGGMRRPYRGLSSFAPEHAGLFFGRERMVEAVANRVRREPLVTVTGPSGSGKSSLLMAGVLPALDDHRPVILRPGARPCAVLARRLAETLELDEAELTELLSDRPETLGSFLERQHQAGKPALLLLVDQAEEVFTLGSDAEERAGFAEALASAGMDPDGATRVVLSLREDYFARLSTLAPLRGLYSRHVEVVATPDREDLFRILMLPASAFGFSFEDSELLEEMVDSVGDEPAALAMLQFCADQLWERRDRTWKRLTRDAYRAIGGVAGALAAHADSVVDAMPAAMQTTARAVLLRCVTEDHTRAVIGRQALLEAIGERAGEVIDRLVEARLLHVLQSDDEAPQSVELVHEALLVHWERLRGWLSDDDHLLRIQARIGQAASRWQDDGRPVDRLLGDGKPLLEAEELLEGRRELLRDDEIAFVEASQARSRSRRRLRRAAIAGLVLLTVLAGGFGVAAWWARGRAVTMQALAEENEKQATDRAVRLVIEQGRRELLEGHPTRAALLLTDALERGGDGPALRSMLAAAMRPVDSHRASWSPDAADEGGAIGQLLVSPDGTRLLGSDYQGRYWLWRLADRAALAKGRLQEGHSRRVTAARFDGDDVVLGSDKGNLVLLRDGKAAWKTTLGGRIHAVALVGDEVRVVADGVHRLARADGAARAEVALEGPITSAAFDPAGSRVAVGSKEGRWVLLGLPDGEVLKEETLDGPVRQTSLAAGLWLALAARPRSFLEPGEAFDYGVELPARSVLSLFDATSLSREAPITVDGRVETVSLAPAGLALARFPNAVELWRAKPPRKVASWAGHERFATLGSATSPGTKRVRFDATGTQLLTQGSDERVHLRDGSSGGELLSLIHRGQVTAVAWHPDGRQVVTADKAEGKPRLTLWQPQLARQALLPKGALPLGDEVVTPTKAGAWRRWQRGDAGWNGGEPEQSSARLHVASDGKTALWEFNRRVQIEGGAKVTVFEPADQVLSLDLHRDTGRLLAGSTDGRLELWSVADGKRLKEIALAGEGSPRVETVTIAPSGKRAVATRRGQLAVVDLDTGKTILATEPPKDGFALAPRAELLDEERRLLDATGALKTKVWSLADQRVLYEVEGNLVAVDDEHLVAVPDGSSVASLHDVTSGALQQPLQGHEEAITAVALVGARIFTGDRGGHLRVWDAATGTCIGAWRAHRDLVQSLHATEDRLLVSALGGSSIWDLRLDERDATTLKTALAAVAPWALAEGRLVPRVP